MQTIGAGSYGLCLWRCYVNTGKRFRFIHRTHRFHSIKSCCAFSNSSGPVRYSPKHKKLDSDAEGANTGLRFTPEPSTVQSLDTNAVSLRNHLSRKQVSRKTACGNVKHAEYLDFNESRGAFCRRLEGSNSDCVLPSAVERDLLSCNGMPKTRPVQGEKVPAPDSEPYSTSDKGRVIEGMSFNSKMMETLRKLAHFASPQGTSDEVFESSSGRTDIELSSKVKNTHLHKKEVFAHDDCLVRFEEAIETTNEAFGLLAKEDHTSTVGAEASILETLDGSGEKVAVSNKAQENAKNLAFHYLAMRSYTASQLRKKLESKKLSPDLIDYAIFAVQKCGFQSDLAFADMFAHSRWRVGSWGPQRIRQGLKQRGVSEDIIRRVLDAVFNEDVHGHVNTSGDDWSEYARRDADVSSISKSALDQLILQAKKQWDRGRNATNDKKVRRLVTWLQYRGFRGNIISVVVHALLHGVTNQD